MTRLFLLLVQRSISAGWMILAVCLIRQFCRRIPRNTICWLWLTVAVRLILLYSPKSQVSLVPSQQAMNRAVSVSIARFSWGNYLAVVWLIGMCFMLLYTLVSYLLLRRQTAASMKIRESIYLCDHIPSPFILGVFHPRIYLPSSMEPLLQRHALAHEFAHLRRQDQLWKPAAFLILCVYWFQPLCWLAYFCFCRDMELAADESVIQAMTMQERKEYSTALLMCGARNGFLNGCPVTFSESAVSTRIKAILRYRRPGIWAVTGALLLSVVTITCFMTEQPVPAPQLSPVQITQEAISRPIDFEILPEETTIPATNPVETISEIVTEAAPAAPTETIQTVDPHPTVDPENIPNETGTAAYSPTCSKHTLFDLTHQVYDWGCESAGYVILTCPYCGEQTRAYDEAKYPALAHDFCAVVSEPAPGRDGFTEYTCTRCNVCKIEDIIPWQSVFPPEISAESETE